MNKRAKGQVDIGVLGLILVEWITPYGVVERLFTLGICWKTSNVQSILPSLSLTSHFPTTRPTLPPAPSPETFL